MRVPRVVASVAAACIVTALAVALMIPFGMKVSHEIPQTSSGSLITKQASPDDQSIDTRDRLSRLEQAEASRRQAEASSEQASRQRAEARRSDEARGKELQELSRARPAIRIDPDTDCRRRLREKGVILPQNAVCIEIDTVIKNLSTAVYRFNKPDEAFVNEPFRVVLVLPTAPGQDVKTPFKSTEGQIEKRTAPYAQNMEATLRGDTDLKITPSGPQARTTTSLEPTTWDWTIVPEKEGDKTLVIEVNAQLVIGTERNRVQLRTIYEDIHVHVRLGHWLAATVWSFVSSLYGMAVSLAILTIAGFTILGHVRKRKTEEEPAVELVTHHHHEDHGSNGGSH